jgi:hypothetical protein
MNCNHDEIVSFYDPANAGGPIMWACKSCWHKFVPMDQLMKEVADEREACAKVCEYMALHTDGLRTAALEEAAENIRAWGINFDRLLDAQRLSSRPPPLKKGEV